MDHQRAPHILLVEDSPHDADLTTRALKRKNLAHNLVHVSDGPSALDYVFGRGKYALPKVVNPPHIILLDINLPKLNGLEVLREIKSHPKTKSIPVVVITSSKEDRDVRQAYEHGANSYIVKPVDFESFQHAVESIGLYWLHLNQTAVPA